MNIGQLLASTVIDSNGYYEETVPANTAFSITVKSQYYGGSGLEASVDVPALSPRERRQVDIVLPHMVRVYGQVRNENGRGIRSTVWVQIDKTKTELCQTDKDGNFNIYMPKDMRGKATACARTYRGEELSKDITIKEEDVPVDLVVKNSGGVVVANKINIFSDVLGDYVWPVPTYTSPLSGVFLVDDMLTLTPEERTEINLTIALAHYKKEKTTYTDSVTVCVAKESTQQTFMAMSGKDMKCTVQRNGNDFVFSLEGYGIFGDESAENYDEDAKLVGKDLSYPLMAAAKTLRNVKPVDAGFPSFTPQLEAKAPLALLITESLNLGKGGIVYYNGGSSDYQKLKNAAAKLGLTNMGEDNEDGAMSVTFYSAKKKMVISLEYDPEAKGVTDKITWEDADEHAPIYMMVLDGVSEDMLRAIMTDDYDTSSTRVTARRHLNPISKCKFDGFKKKKCSKSLPVCVNLPIFAG